MTAAPTPLEGLVLGGRYRLTRLLGAGGMGAVWEAVHVALGHTVAVKVLHAHPTAQAQAAARFLREAAIAASVEHPVVVRALDFGDEQGLHWYAMERLDGVSLEAHLDAVGPMAPADVLALLAPLFDTLAHLHGRGLVHRDLKPANVFLARVPGVDGPVVRLLDFGIARRLDDDVRLTESASLLGSPAYMAPEQARGARDVGPAADQYALAVVVYECVTGELPHAGETLLAMLRARSDEPPRRLSTLRGDLPAGFRAAVMRALSTEVNDRFPTVAAFAEALREGLAVATPSSPEVVLAAPVEVPRTEEAARTETPLAHAATLADAPIADVRRGPSRSTMALAFAMGVGLAGVAVWRARTESPPSGVPMARSVHALVDASVARIEDVPVMHAANDAASGDADGGGAQTALGAHDAGATRGTRRRAANSAHEGATEGSPLLRTMGRMYRTLPR